ncbi:MAG: hypothetical protein ACRDWH_11050 [Acidimicrobiia bacterium]
MIELLERADPAAAVEIDQAGLRANVDEKIGLIPSLSPEALLRRRRPMLAVLASSAVVVAAVAALVLLRPTPTPVLFPFISAPNELGNLPGVDRVVWLESGGVKAMAVDGASIWVMEALQEKLNRVNATTGVIEATHDVGAYVEGVVVGGGYVWLMSYDNGGEVLRFDPALGVVDVTISIGGPPSHSAAWFNGSLWVSNDQGQLHQISPAAEIVSSTTGELKGEGFGYLWVNDPDSGLISSLAPDGTRGDFVIPTQRGRETADGWGVRSVIQAGDYLWLMDGDYPWGTNLSRFVPNSGEFGSFSVLTFGLHSMVEFDGSLWVTSHTDHLLIRVDPASGEVHRYPMPGKAGGLVVADGSLWVALHHPGVLLRLDPSAGLIEAAEIVADDWNRFPHRLLCTGSDEAGGPTVILEPFDWIDYGSWSVVQALLSREGYVVCANGYVEGQASPEERAANLDQALAEAGLTGPYVLVAAGDGVHAARLFADGRNDVAGVILVDPMPVGFQTFLDREIGEGGHPPWADLEPATSGALGDFDDVPFTVIGHDPQVVFLNPRFVDAFGEESAHAINTYWRDGLAFYAGLSTDSRSLTVPATGLDRMIWDRPDLIVEETLAVLKRVGG